MRIIDTHCHVNQFWYEPVESLVAQMDRNGVEVALLVQIKGYFDNDYQAECVRRFPGRLFSVVAVDTTQADAPDQLERLAEQGAHGVRLAPDTRSPGDDPLAVWRKAAELKLPVSVGGLSEQFAAVEFVQVIETLPSLPIIIEHLGGLKAGDGDAPPHPLRQRIFALARYPNVYIKIHGLGEICTRNMPVTTPFPFDPAGLSILRDAYAAFGPQRLMWGSDYPPVSGREGYTNALQLTMAKFMTKPAAEQTLIFGGVAAEVYGLI
jgi:L-fuconolactonase